jgi:AmiR/NasT family two-component response regulator
VALQAALIQAGLQTAINARAVIGQAKGIVMARRRVTADLALEILRRLSQDRQQKLLELAQEIARTGETPVGPWR